MTKKIICAFISILILLLTLFFLVFNNPTMPILEREYVLVKFSQANYPYLIPFYETPKLKDVVGFFVDNYDSSTMDIYKFENRRWNIVGEDLVIESDSTFKVSSK